MNEVGQSNPVSIVASTLPTRELMVIMMMMMMMICSSSSSSSSNSRNLISDITTLSGEPYPVTLETREDSFYWRFLVKWEELKSGGKRVEEVQMKYRKVFRQ